MNTEYENLEPSPIEYFHGKIMDYFHEWRRSQPSTGTNVSINGINLNTIIAKAKLDTYAKYPKQNLREPILKTDM